MKNKLIVSILTLLATLDLNAQQPRRVIAGGGGPDEMKGWPQPKLRAGLSEKEIVASIERYAQKLYDTGRFSGVILVGKEGKTLFTRAFGLADAERKVSNNDDTKFNIGSINKIFTKTAIAQLAASGELSLDDTIRRHLPDYPSALADRITIAQLLGHRSGLGDIFGAKYDAAPPARLRELKDFLPFFAGEPLEFEPGTSQRYSNAGYIVLGLIIERLSGETYRDYVQKHLFTPAGIGTSGFYAVDEKVFNRAIGYTFRGEDGPLTQRRSNISSLPGRPSSAGGAFMAAADLFAFFDALASGRLLPKKWTNWMLSGSFEGGGKAEMGMGGGAPGVNASVEVSEGWTVVALSNYDPPSATALGRGATSIIRGRNAPAAAGRSTAH